MKKLLSLLGTVSLTASSVSGITANTNLQTKNGWQKNINVSPIEQETDYYCAPAVIQMILQYFNVNITDFTQNRIYNDLDGHGESGLFINQQVVNYLNTVRTQHGETRGLDYYLEELQSGFGSLQTEMLLFEFYVTQSLYWNAPVLFGYDQGEDEQHCILFTGIEIDENNPQNTIYHYIDPSYGTHETMHGRDIENYCIEGANLIGVGSNFDFKNKQIKTSITPQNINYNDYVSERHIDLNVTSLFGITNLDELKSFNSLNLPEFHNYWYEWGIKEIDKNGDGWNPKKWFLGTSNALLEYTLTNWEGLMNYAKMYWYTWFTVEYTNNDLHLILYYQEDYENALFTIVPIKIDMTTGSTIIFKY